MIAIEQSTDFLKKCEYCKYKQNTYCNYYSEEIDKKSTYCAARHLTEEGWLEAGYFWDSKEQKFNKLG